MKITPIKAAKYLKENPLKDAEFGLHVQISKRQHDEALAAIHAPKMRGQTTWIEPRVKDEALAQLFREIVRANLCISLSEFFATEDRDEHGWRMSIYNRSIQDEHLHCVYPFFSKASFEAQERHYSSAEFKAASERQNAMERSLGRRYGSPVGKVIQQGVAMV